MYEEPIPSIIKGYKDCSELRLAAYIADMLAQTYQHALEVSACEFAPLQHDYVTFIPDSASAFSRRGFDHMYIAAKQFCNLTGHTLIDSLVKHGNIDQRKLGRKERFGKTKKTSFEVIQNVVGCNFLLLDDVITTGATMDAAASALKQAGASRVDVLALARVY